MTSRLFSEPFPYRGDNNDSDSTKQQHTPDHLYQTSSSSSEGSSIMSSSKYATAAFVASSAGLGASDIDSMYNNMVRPEDLLDSLHHHLQLQQQQQHQSQHHHQQQQRLRQQQHHHLQSSADRMQDLDLWSSAFDPCSVPSTSSSISSAAIAPLTTIAEATPTYLSFLPSFSSLPPGVPSFLPTSSSAAGDENGHHYFIDSSAGLMMESRQSTPPGHDHSSSSSSSSSSASSSKSSSPSASSSLVSSPTSTYFDESAVMLPAITACASCKRSHIKCDSGRPCQNCLKHPSKALTCRDATPKPRGRPKGGSKAAAEAIMLARLYQQQQQQHQMHLQEQLHRHHQQQQQPSYVPRPRVMSLPQRPTRSTYQVVPTVPHQHRYLSSQGSPQSVSLDYHAHSRSSPASPATLEHRVVRLGRRPSLPVWNHPYAMHRSSSSSGPHSSASSSSPVIAPPVVPSSSHTAMTTSMGANNWAGFSSSTLGLTSMAQEFSHSPSIGSPNGSRSVVLAHQQGLDSMSLMQQQHRVAAVPLALRGTALCRQTSITENNDNVPQAWLALQMLQASLPPSSSMPLVSTAAPLVAVSSSPAVSPCPSAVSTFSSTSTTTTQLMTFKQHQHAFSEEREMIKEEEEEENMCVGSNDTGITFNPIGYSHHDHDSEEECEREQKKEEEEEREEGRRRMEAMLQHEMQFELQFLQQRQQLLQYQQEQVQREQALVRLNLQKQRNVSSHQLYPYPQQNGHGPVPFF
ncbi:hypothetical protein KI688_010807 [Linnemannia hyalina]|uniref:Zn(2)-C6 fungal-type domain-containing protein n=1 Tax=Linnemannia hyalina TaxID=64524 RepID=A0A9P8BX50_9FUNG|nr:hypothetical protein KI688_010807 [Linnemannia hyalina]